MAVKESGLSIVTPELRKRKRELEKELLEAVKRFQAETGLKVTKIEREFPYWYSTDPEYTGGYTQDIKVTVEV